MQSRVKKRLESRMLGNLHVRFGVGVKVELLGLHHGDTRDEVWSAACAMAMKLTQWLPETRMTDAITVKMDELRQLVERKTETVRLLEALLEKEDAELVELERQLETLEDQGER